MGQVVLFIIAVLVALVQHGLLATVPLAPDLPLALAAWAVVAGGESGLLVRAWLVGMARDLIDPGSLCFHTFAYFLLALAFLPVRRLVHHDRAAGWMAYAALSYMALTVFDRWLAGMSVWWPLASLLAVAGATALASVALGWTLSGLPKALRPTANLSA